MNIDTFLEQNFAPILGVIFQIIILATSSHFTKQDRKMFISIIVLECLELISYNIESYLGNLSYLTIWRYIFSNAGYILRPLMVYPFIMLVRANTYKKDSLRYFDLIPLAFVIIIYQFTYFTDWVYSFSESNHFHRGPLGYTSQIITLLYVAELIYLVIRSRALKTRFNLPLIGIEVTYIASSMILESIFDVKALGINALVYSTVFFMFALQSTALTEMVNKVTKLGEIDGLSGILNRVTGENRINDILKDNTPGLLALFDVDGFKEINDTYGHAVGDEAIIKIAEIMKDNVLSNSVSMRLGGDEFAIWTSNYTKIEEAKVIIEKMLLDLDEVRLSADQSYRIHVSVGLVVYDGKSITDFDELYRKADQKLYVAKTYEGNSYIA